MSTGWIVRIEDMKQGKLVDANDDTLGRRATQIPPAPELRKNANFTVHYYGRWKA